MKKLGIVIFVLALFSPLLPQEKKEKQKTETFTAVAMGTRGAISARTLQLTIRVQRYTTNEEVIEFANLLKEKGVDGLRRRLEQVKVGKISPPATIGTDIAIARSFPREDGGRLVRVVTARYMGFLELYGAGRSTDYPFAAFEFELDADGKGKGSALAAIRMKFTEDNTLEVESLGQPSIMLSNVRQR